MAITRTPMVDDDGTGTTGTVINNAWKQQFYDQIDAADAAIVAGVPTVGVWVPIAYAAGNFTGSAGMTWTVEAADQSVFQYALMGKVCVINFGFLSTTIGGTVGVQLNAALPFTVAVQGTGNIRLLNGGVWENGIVQTQSGGAALNFFRPSLGAFVAGTNNTNIQGSVICGIP